MDQPVDFAKLTLQDALDLAILIEEEAHDRYAEFASQLETHRTVDAAAFFRDMAKNEAKHGEEIRKRRVRLFGDAPSKVDRSMLWDVEAPEVSEARAFMSRQKALTVAMDAEVKAYEFFRQALPAITDPDVRELFEELRDEELEHQEMVKLEMAAAGAEDDHDPEDHIDPPVGN